MYNWIVRLTRDPATAEDLVVETFWRIHRAHARFDPPGSFGAWARRIATNLAIGHLRRKRREVNVPNSLLETRAGPGAADSVERREEGEAIRRAFDQLPLKLRTVALLALVEERPYAEIASALGISVGAVKSRELRAVRLLRRKLRKWESNHERTRVGETA